MFIKTDYHYDNNNFGHNDLFYNIKVNKVPKMQNANMKILWFDNNVQHISSIPSQIKINRIYHHDSPIQINSDEPTLVMSLFIDTLFIKNNNIDTWIDKYLTLQLKACIAHKHYFPHGNIQLYWDIYLKKECEKLSKNIDIYLDNLCSNEVDNYSKNYMNILYDSYVNYVNAYFKKVKTDNFFHVMMLLFELTCANFDTGHVNSYPVIYTYELSKLYRRTYFKMSRDMFHKEHAKNGYIGQYIRYISLLQKDFVDKNGVTIYHNKHILIRDAHVFVTNDYDHEQVRKVNKYCRNNGKSVFNVFGSLMYDPKWADEVVIYGNASRKTVFAGIGEYCNFENNSSKIYDPELGTLCSSLCLPFVMYNGRPIMEKIRRAKNYKSFSYGVDEYILSNFLCEENTYVDERIVWNNIYLNRFAMKVFSFSNDVFINKSVVCGIAMSYILMLSFGYISLYDKLCIINFYSNYALIRNRIENFISKSDDIFDKININIIGELLGSDIVKNINSEILLKIIKMVPKKEELICYRCDCDENIMYEVILTYDIVQRMISDKKIQKEFVNISSNIS